MKWSWRIARVSGIDVKIHITFLFILVLGASQWSEFGWPGMAFGAALMLLLFLCVLLHEFGHSLVAQRFGISVREIILLPIGGLALMGRIPDKPMQELLVAVAGPAVNIVIALLLAAALAAMGLGDILIDAQRLFSGEGAPSFPLLLLILLNLNVMLVLFNMIPAFPLDGGRVLRSVLGFFMSWTRATRIAASIGQMLAVLLAMWAVSERQWLSVLVAAFIFFGAGAEGAETQARAVLASRRVGDFYNKYALSLSPSDSLGRVVDFILTSYQPDFAVLHGRQIVGIVTRQDVIEALAAGPIDRPVTGVMQRNVAQLDARLPLDQARPAMADAGTRVAAVYDGEIYLGLISIDDIAEAIRILSFLNPRPTEAQAAIPPAREFVG